MIQSPRPGSKTRYHGDTLYLLGQPQSSRPPVLIARQSHGISFGCSKRKKGQRRSCIIDYGRLTGNIPIGRLVLDFVSTTGSSSPSTTHSPPSKPRHDPADLDLPHPKKTLLRSPYPIQSIPHSPVRDHPILHPRTPIPSTQSFRPTRGPTPLIRRQNEPKPTRKLPDR